MKYFTQLVNSVEGGVFVIAEACDNHMGSIDMAKYLVDAAKFCGADAVKFQHHIVEEEMIKNAITSSNFSEPLHDFLQRNSLTLADHIELKDYCDKRGILYLCTPFSFKAAIEINNLVPFFKIGSGEFQDFWYLDRLSSLNKPILFSCGMCTEDEIVFWKNRFKSKFENFAILNTISEYPPVLEDMNISFIKRLINIFNSEIIIGHSDHTQTSFTSVLAVSKGARIIEKHLTLSHFVKGPDKDVSLDIDEFAKMVQEVKSTLKTLGEKKLVQAREKDIRAWAYRSMVYAKDLNKGDILSLDDIKSKRPGDGDFLSSEYESLVGRVLNKSVKSNSKIKRGDF